MTVKPAKSLLLAIAVALAVTPLAASTDIIRTRIAGFRELGAAFKGVNDSLRGGQVQSVVLGQYAREIRKASRDIHGWFPAGSGPKAGVKTAALAAIWSKPAAFKKAQDSFQISAIAFEKAAKSKDVAAIRTAARNLGGTCKACHDSFRAETD